MVAIVALSAETVAPHCEDGRDRWGAVSTGFISRLLPNDRQETTCHQFAQDRAKLLALADRQPFPQMVSGIGGVGPAGDGGAHRS